MLVSEGGGCGLGQIGLGEDRCLVACTIGCYCAADGRRGKTCVAKTAESGCVDVRDEALSWFLLFYYARTAV